MSAARSIRVSRRSPDGRIGPNARIRWLGLVAACVALSLPALAQAPPSDLKRVDDHWTAWDPPAEVAEGAEVYVIQQGDTLWDLAERLYGNPYLWPQIWERNRYILDAHWIYPGDPLILGIEVESAEGLPGPGESTVPGAEGAEPGLADEVAKTAPRGSPSLLFGRRGTETPFRQLGTPDDIYCSGFVGREEESFAYHVIGSEFDLQNPSMFIQSRGRMESVFGNVDTGRFNLSLGDIVYIDGGRAAGLAPGDVFTVIRQGDRIRHPLTRRPYGRYYVYEGRVRVLSVQETTAIAEISQACEPVLIGSGLRPFVPEPIPSERRTPLRPVNMPVSGEALKGAPVILHSKRGLVSLGEDHVVFVAMGEEDGVEPGDVFTVYRSGRGGSPALVLGELAILSVHGMSSTAKILISRYPLYIGDFLIRK